MKWKERYGSVFAFGEQLMYDPMILQVLIFDEILISSFTVRLLSSLLYQGAIKSGDHDTVVGKVLRIDHAQNTKAGEEEDSRPLHTLLGGLCLITNFIVHEKRCAWDLYITAWISTFRIPGVQNYFTGQA